jgi:hypothetical protein
VHNVDLMELAPRMCPARGFVDVLAIEVMKARVGIGLQSTLERLQMLAWMFALAICRVCEPDRRRGLIACRSVIAHVCPQPASLGLAVARSEHWQRRIVGVQLAAGENMLLNRVNQWTKQVAGCSDPTG